MENHVLLIKCALTTNGQPHSFLLRGGSDNIWKNLSTALPNSSDNLYGNPPTSYYIWSQVTAREKRHPLVFERKQWKHTEIHPLSTVFWYLLLRQTAVTTFMEIHQWFSKYAVTVTGKLHPLLFKREEWQREKNNIHCLVKQQWQHLEIYPFLINFVKKLNAFLFKRHYRQHVENHIHFYLEASVTIFVEIHPLLTN